MAYLRISDDAMDHPKLCGLSDGAHRFWFNANCWVQKHLTNGRIPVGIVSDIPRFKPARVRELIAAGLWHKDGVSYVVHDFLVHNDSREIVEERRKKKAQRMETWRERRRSMLTVDAPVAIPQDAPQDAPRARTEPSPSTSPHLSKEEETLLPSRRLHQSARPNRMNPAGVVPLLDTQFGEFVSRVSPEYPDRSNAYAAVLAWMDAEDDAATARGKSIGGDPFKWWQARFDAWKRDDAPAAPTTCRRRHSPPCPNDAACTKRYMDEQQGIPAAVAS
jgi:hypothetical protein